MSATGYLFYGFHILINARELERRWFDLCGADVLATFNRGRHKRDRVKTFQQSIGWIGWGYYAAELLKRYERGIDMREYTTYDRPNDPSAEPYVFVACKDLFYRGGSSEYTNEKPTLIDLTKQPTPKHDALLSEVRSVLGLTLDECSPIGWYLTCKGYEDT